MRPPHLIVITGAPATGKTTLARELAAALGLPLIGKDMIKERLLDSLGAGDSAHGRALSDASFAVQFALARELLCRGIDLIVEGNFRAVPAAGAGGVPGGHERGLLGALPPHEPGEPCARIAQILCRVEEPLRVARLAARGRDPDRHPGHRDALLAAAGVGDTDRFLELPGERIIFDGSQPQAAALVRWLGTWRAALRNEPAIPQSQ
jgi:hypothetical protein